MPPPPPPPVPSFPDSRPKTQMCCFCPSCLAQGAVRLLAASASNHQGVDRAGHPCCGAWSREDGRLHRGNGSCSPIYSYGLPNGTEIGITLSYVMLVATNCPKTPTCCDTRPA